MRPHNSRFPSSRGVGLAQTRRLLRSGKLFLNGGRAEVSHAAALRLSVA